MSTIIKNIISAGEPRHITLADFDTSRAKQAVKVTKVNASLLTKDTEIVTQMKDGHIETRNMASAGDIVLTNPDGEQYAIKPQKFTERYGEWIGDGEYSPKAAPITYMIIDEDVTLDASWGEKMHIKSGGAIVLESSGDGIYGIQPEAFANTYQDLDLVDDAQFRA